MRNLANDTLSQVKGIWGRLDAGQRFVVTAVMAATLVGFGAIVWFAGQPSYETVYTVKPGDDVAAITQALQRSGVTWREDENGRSFQVERSQKGKAQRAIAETGITGGDSVAVGGGLSLIEDSATKQWKLDLASRTAAANAIKMGLDGVQAVTVTASVPRHKTAFRDRDAEQRPTATVVLRLRPGTSFESIAQVAASIASSQLMVPKQNIEVASSSGNQRYRYDPDREAGGGNSSDFLALQRSMADDRARMAQDRLDQLWPGKTSVSVQIELDPAWELRSEKVLPPEPIVKSEKSKKDETKPGAKKDGDPTGGTSSNVDKTREFVTEIGERRSGKMMQDIRRMTVALTYDKSLAETAGFDPKNLENVVKAIVGWDPARDKPECFSSLVGEFAPPPEMDVVGGPGLAEIALQWGPTVGQVVGVLVVVMFLRGLFKRSGVGSAGAAAATPATSASRVETPLEQLPPDEQQKIMRREIERSIASDPAALAKLLEAWLVEQRA